MRLLMLISIIGLSNYAKAVDLGGEVFKLFQLKCFKCHGEPGQRVRGNFDYVLDFAKLRKSSLLDLANPESSVVYTMIKDDLMPDDGAFLNADQKALVLNWIKKGAPDSGEAPEPNPDPPTDDNELSDEETFQLILKDLTGMNAKERKLTRYFSFAALGREKMSAEQLQNFRNALIKLVNGLHWMPSVAKLTSLGAQGLVFRINLRDLGWSTSDWEQIVDGDPYLFVNQGRFEKEIRNMTQTNFPLLRADSFVFRASRPPLYEKILKLPKTAFELETWLGLNVNKNITDFKVHRAGFRGGQFPDGSGVSRNNRMIERHQTLYGAYWKSYDFSANTGAQNIFERPLGPEISDQTFQQAGGEMIFNLPNGLQAYMIVDAGGLRLDQAPISIVQDPRRIDSTVTNGISCMSCHQQGMQEHFDQIAPFVNANTKGYTARTREQVNKLFSRDEVLKSLFLKDRSNFEKALENLKLPLKGKEPTILLADEFEKPLSETRVQAELGLSNQEWKDLPLEYPEVAKLYSEIRNAGVTRERFSQIFLQLKSLFAQRSDQIEFSEKLEKKVVFCKNCQTTADQIDRFFSALKSCDLLNLSFFARVISIEQIDPKSKLNILQTAISESCEDGVDFVLDSEAISLLLKRNAQGESALVLALRLGRFELVDKLLSFFPMSFDLAVFADRQGLSPLHWAVFQSHLASVERLLSIASVKPDSKDHTGLSALDYAKQMYREHPGREGLVDIVQLLKRRN